MVLLKNGDKYYCSEIYCISKKPAIAPKYFMDIEFSNGKSLMKKYDTEVLCDNKISAITTALRDDSQIIITL